MATFNYTAMDRSGKEIKSSVEAATKDEAIALIKADGNIPITVSETSVLNRDIKLSFVQPKPKVRDLSVFCRQFVSIVNAGVPIASALEMLSEQTENAMLSKAIEECKISIQSGTSLSEAMSVHDKIFPPYFVTMVEAGEASGSLEVAFERMAIQFEKDNKVKAMARKATIYPIAILVIAIGVIALLLAFVIPQFETMLTDLGTELPALTQVVVAASDFLQGYWYIVLGLIALLIFTGKVFVDSTVGKYTIARLQLRIPLVKNLVTKTSSARLCRTMSTLMAAGIPIIEAIDIVSNTMSNVLFKDALIAAKDDVAMGTPFSEPIERAGIFPPMIKHMIKIGEEVGDIEGMMEKTADYYEEETETAVQALIAIMEPVIIMVLALVVGVIVMAVMLPMMEMMNRLGNM